MAETAKIGIVTVSDRASAGVYADEGGPAIVDYLERALPSPGMLADYDFKELAASIGEVRVKYSYCRV